MINPALILHLQTEAERDYLKAVEAAEKTLGAELEAGIARVRDAFRGAETGDFSVAPQWLSYRAS